MTGTKKRLLAFCTTSSSKHPEILLGCPLHLVHLAAEKGASVLPVSPNDILVDIYSYFSKSSLPAHRLAEFQEKSLTFERVLSDRVSAVANTVCPENHLSSVFLKMKSESDSEVESDHDEDECNNNRQISKCSSPKTYFKLSFLHDLDDAARSMCLDNLIGETNCLRKLSKIHIKNACGKSCDCDGQFTPWWDTSHSTKVRIVSDPVEKRKNTSSNWFKKSSSDSSDWLSGPSMSKTADDETKVADPEDIDVPSIYDMKPKPKGRRALKRDRKALKEKTTGRKWYDMKAPDVNEKLKMDMEMLQMRSVLDPKRFYKHNDRKGMPKYFQMGTVVDEGTDFYSSRLTKKQRKETLVEELMADVNIRQYNKKKYEELQHKHRGKKFRKK